MVMCRDLNIKCCRKTAALAKPILDRIYRKWVDTDLNIGNIGGYDCAVAERDKAEFVW